MKRVGLLIVVALVAAAGGAAGWMHFGRRGSAATAAEPVPPAYVEIKTLTVRLADTDGEHYIKVLPVLAVTQAVASDVSKHLPIARDAMVSVIAAKTSTQLMAPAGDAELKKELIAAVNRRFGGGVVGIYFDEYLVE